MIVKYEKFGKPGFLSGQYQAVARKTAPKTFIKPFC